MRDLDLLVPVKQRERAWQALLAAGWVRDYPASMDGFYADHQHLSPLRDPHQAGVVVELHSGLFREGGPFDFPADDLFREARPVAVGGCSVGVPSARHLLLHLSMHLVWGHLCARGLLRALTDLAALWPLQPAMADLVRSARQARAGSCCYWTLRLGRQLLGVPVPDAMLAALAPRHPAWMLDLLERHFAAQSGLLATPCPSVRLRRALWSAAVEPGRNGHGAARPWAAGLAWAAHGAGDAAVEARKAPDPGRATVSAVWRYAGALLHPG
jgi:hypothetical protein